MQRGSAHPFRRTAIVALIAAVATTASFTLTSLAGAEEQFVTGSAKGTARLARVGPSAAQLSLSSSTGLVLSDYIGHRARSESRAFDFAGLQGTMENTVPQELRTRREEDDFEGFDNPLTPWDERNGTGPFQLFPTLRTESNDPGAASGTRWEPQPGVVQDVSASDAPLARASFRLQALSLPGLLEVTGGQARSFAGIYRFVEGEGEDASEKLVRAAGGTVDIGRVSLLDGLVVLRGLRWEVAQITDENDDDSPEAIGRFAVGRFEVQGQETQQLEGESLAPAFEAANAALEPMGLRIERPERSNESGIVNLTPLRIVVESERGQPILDPLQSDVIGPAGQEFIKGCMDANSGEEDGGDENGDGGDDGGDGGDAESTGGGDAGLLGRVDPGAAVLAHHGAEHESFEEFSSDGPGGDPEEADPREVRRVGSSPCGVPFLAADLMIAPFSGAGTLDIDLGGVFGTTEGTSFENPFGGGFGPGDGGFGPGDGGSGSGDGGSEGSGGGTPSFEPEQSAGAAGASDTSDTSPPTTQPAPPTTEPYTPTTALGDELQASGPREVNLRTSPASATWALGTLGLAAAMAMAAADYRRIRSRRRSVTPIS